MCKRNASAAGHGVANAVRLDDEGASAHRPGEFLQPWAVVAKIDVALQGPLDLTTPALDDPSQAPMVVRADAEGSWGEAAKGRQCLDEAGSVESGVRALGQLHQLGQRIHAAQRVKVGEVPGLGTVKDRQHLFAASSLGASVGTSAVVSVCSAR
jgi:hypothetical protein